MQWFSSIEVSDALDKSESRVRQLSIQYHKEGNPGVRKQPGGRRAWEWSSEFLDEYIRTQAQASKTRDSQLKRHAELIKAGKTFISKESESTNWETFEHLPDVGDLVELPDGTRLQRWSVEGYQQVEKALLEVPFLKERAESHKLELERLKGSYEAHVATYEDQMKYLRERLVAMEENFSNTIQAMRERNFIEAKNVMNQKDK
jgi:hypothetical protein